MFVVTQDANVLPTTIMMSIGIELPLVLYFYEDNTYMQFKRAQPWSGWVLVIVSKPLRDYYLEFQFEPKKTHKYGHD